MSEQFTHKKPERISPEVVDNQLIAESRAVFVNLANFKMCRSLHILKWARLRNIDLDYLSY